MRRRLRFAATVPALVAILLAFGARMRARSSGWDNGLVCTLEAVLVAPSGGAHGGSKAAKVKENLPTRQ
jgi:hypothetical protein